ncbi:MAG TPA: hypothetical protein VLV30_05875, partial [Methanomicrobiales archaeon]|nr:hypothetical protein [Methanomicrobiales archaeon]
MKSTMKLLIVALAVFLVVFSSPVAARTPTIKNIVAGDHIFVYEKDLNVAGLTGTVTAFRKFVDDDVTKAIIKEIPVTNQNDFTVDSAIVGGVYGLYYPVNGNVVVAGDKADSAHGITIEATDLSIGVYLVNRIDSVDGKSLTRTTNITFKIAAPDFGTYYKITGTPNVYPGKADLRIVTPNGGELTRFGFNQVSLAGINITGSANWTDSQVGTVNTNTVLDPNGFFDPIMLQAVDAGTYTATMKFSAGTDFYKQAGTDSNAVTFTVLSKPITLTTNKESVVRGNDFVVTITGESLKNYYLYIKGASVTAPKTYPFVLDGQVSVNNTAAAIIEIAGTTIGAKELSSDNGMAVNGTAAIVSTKADGTRSIEFNTTSTTDDKKYTVKAVDPLDNSKYDQVDVTVEKGQVTITYEGTGSYYLGETVKLTGTDTDSKNVYLFLKGPNLNDPDGVSLADVSVNTVDPCPNGNSCWEVVDVNTDNTWSFKWDTSSLTRSLDAGTYTIYAVAVNASGASASLADKTYATASVVLKKPFVTASASTNTLAKGDILYITGTAEGKPTNVYVWLFGKNYQLYAKTATVNSDASYSYKLDRGDTEGLYAGQYFAVVQHPMMNGIADVVPAISVGGTTQDSAQVVSTGAATYTGGAPEVKLAGLQASDAATALVDLLNSAN